VSNFPSHLPVNFSGIYDFSLEVEKKKLWQLERILPAEQSR